MWWKKVNQVILEMDKLLELEVYGKPVDMQDWRMQLQSAIDEADNEVDDAYEDGFKQGMEWMREAMKRDD